MTDRAAFTADFSDMRIVKTRKVVQWVYETPIESMQAVLNAMGGPPHPGHSVTVAIARLETQPAKVETPKGKTPSQRAWALCQSPRFAGWIGGYYGMTPSVGEMCAEVLRTHLQIKSRGELDTNPEARARFETLEREYQEAMR